jgi:nucleotide-binding universal stress UspA family protein
MSPVLAFGDDRSPEADVCWDWIAGHVWEGWSLDIVTADAPEDMHPVSEEEASLHRWDPPQPRHADGLGFGSVEHLRADVDPRLALISRPWDLVAIGPRGSGLLKRLHLGSTADWLLREPTSPLVIAHRPGPVRRVLLAADGSPHAQRAMECLVSLPWITDTTVHIVSVDDGRVDAEKAVAGAERALGEVGVETAPVIRSGRPTHAILDICRELSPDLVVMGARGITGLRRVVIGSTTAAVAGSTDHSILVAHAWGADEPG